MTWRRRQPAILPLLALGGLLAGGAVGLGQSGSPAGPPPGYTLVWADEFETPGPPDPANWSFESGFVRNEELQWYQPENARVEGGRLVIEARRERRPNPRYEAGSTDWRRNREWARSTPPRA